MIYKKGYKTIQGNECLNACMANYLNYTGNKIQGNMIFWGGGGFHLLDKREGEYGIVTDAHKNHFNFTEKYKIPYVTGRFLNDSDKAKQYLKEAIYAERMVIIETKANYLTYSTVFNRTMESSHFINVIGISEDESQLYISDGYVPTVIPSTFEGWISFDVIFKAWQEAEFLYNEFQDLDEALYEKLHIESINQFYICLDDYLNPEATKDSEWNCGEKIIRGVFEDMTDYCRENMDMVSIIEEMNFYMKAYGFLFSKFFIVEQLIAMDVEEKIITSYKDIISRWNNLCFYMLKISVTKRWKDIQKLQQRAFQLIQDERQILLLVLKLVKKMPEYVERRR